MEGIDWISLDILNRIGAVAILMLGCILVITDKLIWHTRFKRVQERADRWERVALDALGASHVAVRAVEVTNEVLTKLPEAVERSDET